MKRTVSTRRFILLVLFSSLAALILIFGGSPSNSIISLSSSKFNFALLSSSSDDEVTIATENGAGDDYFVIDENNDVAGGGRIGCILPSVYPDPSWIPSFFKPISCSAHGQDIVSIVEGGSVLVTQPTNSCSYGEVTFVSDFKTKSDKTDQPLPNGLSPCPSDVFRVACVNPLTNEPAFESLFRCIARKQTVTARVSAPPKPLRPDQLFEERLNILMFGLDSVSRVSWLEQMVKTTEFVTKTLGGVTFEGYNIVGDGTTAAILGLTTGYLEEELHESRRGFEKAKQIDDFPFIWYQLANEASYTTLWDEDGASLGTFHYRLTGFKVPPVDYYGRLFQLTLENKYPTDACLGTVSTFEEMARQFRHLFAAYPDPVRKFALVFNSHYSHTSSGAGGQEAYRADELLLNEIKMLSENGHLNESVLILFADHGSRFDGSRATNRGKISERLPYLMIAFPPWFRRKYPRQIANLKAATRRLTTPFDLHRTLLDIAGVDPKPGTPRRGLSFFKPIPLERTCEDAGISAHWCVCLAPQDDGNRAELALDDALVTRSLAEFENYINSVLLKSFIANGECVPLKAKRPFAARRLSLRNEVAHFVKTIDGHGRLPQFDATAKPTDGGGNYLQVSFWTEPGDGQWEVTFAHNLTTGSISVLPKQISRTNRYGSAPKCVQDRYPHLRQFCFCSRNNIQKL